MRYAPTFFSVVALLWCSAAVLRIPNLTWAVPAYVIAQCAFALIGFLGLTKEEIFLEMARLIYGIAHRRMNRRYKIVAIQQYLQASVEIGKPESAPQAVTSDRIQLQEAQ